MNETALDVFAMTMAKHPALLTYLHARLPHHMRTESRMKCNNIPAAKVGQI